MSNTVSRCSLCGMCKVHCPVFLATLNEGKSPRAKATWLKEEVSTTRFYECTLCGACVRNCPADVDMQLRKRREALVQAGTETKANKKMIANIRAYGNPYGEKKDSEDTKQYSC